MIYDPYADHRRSSRLPQYDYSQNGAYFITICTFNHEPIFGHYAGARRAVPLLVLNESGTFAQEQWLKTAVLRQNVTLDKFVVMPNHIHGIIILDSLHWGTARRAPTEIVHGYERRALTPEGFGKPLADSIPTIVRAYKSAVTRCINESRKTPGAPVWQRNYYEHVVRDEDDLNRIREYIEYNPVRWEEDEENPSRTGT